MADCVCLVAGKAGGRTATSVSAAAVGAAAGLHHSERHFDHTQSRSQPELGPHEDCVPDAGGHRVRAKSAAAETGARPGVPADPVGTGGCRLYCLAIHLRCGSAGCLHLAGERRSTRRIFVTTTSSRSIDGQSGAHAGGIGAHRQQSPPDKWLRIDYVRGYPLHKRRDACHARRDHAQRIRHALAAIRSRQAVQSPGHAGPLRGFRRDADADRLHDLGHAVEHRPAEEGIATAVCRDLRRA